MEKKIYRQGDVLIERIDGDIPEAATKLPREAGLVTLARGEATGHHHSIANRGVCMYQCEDGRYLNIGGKTPAVLFHQEHSKVELPPGRYKVTIQREYVAGELRNVAD